MKLVRDNIPDMMRRDGKEIEVRVADDNEYELMLFKKLQEEVIEFVHDKNTEEMADIEEVLRCIADFRGIRWDAVEEIRKKKNLERGSFKGKIILDRVK